MKIRLRLATMLLALLGSACATDASKATSRPTSPGLAAATQVAILDIPPEALVSDGGGQPATAPYWAEWNSCSGGDKAAIAEANGGAAAGWYLLDDFLGPPGVWVGDLAIVTCQQAFDILQIHNISGQEMNGDLVYPLASQLLAAQINVAVGAEFCAAAEETILAAHILLSHLGFDGTGDYLVPDSPAEDRQSAQRIAELLAFYNTGMLCR